MHYQCEDLPRSNLSRVNLPHLGFSFIFMPEYLIVDKRLVGLHSQHTARIICFKRLDISGFSEVAGEKKIISLLLLINEVELSRTKELNCSLGLIKPTDRAASSGLFVLRHGTAVIPYDLEAKDFL